MTGKFVIIDGSSLIHRAFYALPTMTTSGGQFTNAVFGFTNMLLKLAADLKPAGIVVAFDKGKYTFRNDEYAEYKAQRKPTPSELSEQFPAAREVLGALGITVLEIEGFEADDIIGTLAAGISDKHEVLIVTGDRDALQLVNERVHVLLTKKGISEFEEVDQTVLTFQYGLTAGQVIEMKGLMGDASDNIPGVPGVGEKTAKKLISDFGSIEGVYENIEKISGQKLKEKLLENREMAYLSRKLATIVCDVPVPIDVDQYLIKTDMDKVRKIAEKYEFRALPAKAAILLSSDAISDESAAGSVNSLQRAERLETEADFAAFAAEVIKNGCLFFVAKVQGKVPDCSFTGAGVANGNSSYFVTAQSQAWQGFLRVLADPAVRKVTHDAKPVYNACQNCGHEFAGLTFDSMLAAYLLNPSGNEYKIERLVNDFTSIVSVAAPPKKEDDTDYLVWAAECLPEIYRVQRQDLDRIGASDLLADIELPLIKVLSLMEQYGVQVDSTGLERMDREIAKRIQLLLQTIYESAGESFNVNSTKQLGIVLFEKLGLPTGKKTKTGYSTDAEVLENLAGAHPIVDSLLEYRMLTKLKSTYLDGLRPLISERTGRIHTTFNQTVTATGRLSSSEPNLQNIPVRTELGRQIRNLFVPGIGYDWLVAADYSQIELRVLAHLAADEGMLDSFRMNEDIHTRTAAEVFGVPLDEVTPALRSRAKAVNFGIVYGISDYGLSQGIGVNRKEAAEYIAGYFSRYPAVRDYIDRTVAEARMTGYVCTLFGRRRYLPDINSANFNLRAFAERTAMNTPVQGTAADIIKKAMLDVQTALFSGNFKSRMLLQVHDELVLEVPDSELEQVSILVKMAMENAAVLSVPLLVDVKHGSNWAQTK